MWDKIQTIYKHLGVSFVLSLAADDALTPETFH